MSAQDENIRNIFSEKLGQFETPVDPTVWTGVQAGISAGAAGSTGIGGLGLLKIVAGLVVAGGIITAVVLSTDSAETPVNPEVEHAQKEQVEIEDEQPQADDVLVDNDSADQLPTVVEETSPEPSEEIQPETGVEEAVLVEVTPTEIPETEIHSYEIARGAPPTPAPEVTEAAQSEPTQQPEVKFSAEFVASKDKHTYNLYTFTAHAIEDAEYLWELGDGETASGLEVSHEYYDDGEFTVRLSVIVGEQEEQHEAEIKVAEPSHLKVPNVFSPNGDSWNNYFDVEADSKNIELIALVVFDSSGNRVFEADEYRKKWDGNDLHGNPCPSGIYSYYVKAIGSDGKDWNTAGTVTLMQ